MKKSKFIAFKENNEIDILTDIGSGVFFDGYNYSDFVRDISGMDGDISVNIKSYGGDVHEALAIYDALRAIESKITTKIVGATASAGTIISLAGDVRLISANSRYLIHRVMGGAFGNVDDLNEVIAQLEDYDKQLISMYEKNTGMSAENLLSLMRKNKFITANEAIKLGFIDGLIPEKSIKNKEGNQLNNENSNDMNKVFNKLGVADETEALSKISNLQTVIQNKEDEEKEMKKSNEDKDEEIENLKAEIAKLKKALEEKDEKEKENKINAIIEPAIKAGKLKTEARGHLLNMGMTQGVEALEKFVNDLPEPKIADMIEGSASFESRYKSKSEITNAWKSGEISTLEYQKELTNLKQ